MPDVVLRLDRTSANRLMRAARIDGLTPEAEALERAIEVSSDDPRRQAGGVSGPGGPQERNSVVADSRGAVLLTHIESFIAHMTRKGGAAGDAVAFVLGGPVNQPPDDPDATRDPDAEPVQHLYLTTWEGVANVVVNLQALAARAGASKALGAECQRQWDELPSDAKRRAP